MKQMARPNITLLAKDTLCDIASLVGAVVDVGEVEATLLVALALLLALLVALD